MSVVLILVYVVCGIYMLLNFKHDIHMLQQNSYRLPRYWKYLENGDISSMWRVVDIAMIFLLFSTLVDIKVSLLIVAAACLCLTVLILRRKSKKPLVFTKRVWRIYGVVAVIASGLSLAGIFLFGKMGDTIGFYPGPAIAAGVMMLLSAFSWAVVMLSVVILIPVEKHINRKYWNEAKGILTGMPGLRTVAVTGSYGKTSTKHYLERLLSEKYEVLMTPGSYNTTMGVIRTIRELMKPYTEVFICEMGAKQPGDIKEICELVNPEMGIVTAVGPMHLETFKTMGNVQKTKFELIDALPPDGLAVINNDFEYCKTREVLNVKAVRYSLTDADADYRAEDIVYSHDGTSFTVKGPDGLSLPLHTQLVGDCNISNLLAAVIIALKLGVGENRIRYAVEQIEQVEHRLNVKRSAGGITVIDDAFNSNPHGSKMAMEVLSGFTEGRRIVVTPGMIELGERQQELNEEFGRLIARNADIAVIVGKINREALLKGVRDGEMEEDAIFTAANFAEAQQILSSFMKSGDTVLYENDLPDAFE